MRSFGFRAMWLLSILAFGISEGFVSAGVPVRAAPAVDLDLLTDVICHQIEPDLKAPHPEWSVGDSGTSLGQCQIQYRTAVRIGGLDPKVEGFPVLGNVARSKVITRNILGWCNRDQFETNRRTGKLVLVHEARTTVMGIASCYNGSDMAYPSLGLIRLVCARAESEDDPRVQWKAEKKCKAYRNLRAYAERVDAAYTQRLVAQK